MTETTTEKVHTKVTRFWRHIFGGQCGLLMVWTGERDENGRIPKNTIQFKVFNYPKADKTAAEWALEKSEEGREVYFCVHLLTEHRRIKENAAPVAALWGDLDGAEVPNGTMTPSAVVESSPGRFHCYWRLTDAIPPETAEGLNRRRAHQIGADPSGFDLTQLLRVPGTGNRKYDGCPLVELRSLDGGKAYSPRALEKILPNVEEPKGRSDPKPNEDESPIVLSSQEALKVWRGEAPRLKESGEVDKSATLLHIGRVL